MRGQDRGHGREGLGPGHVFKMVSESPFFFLGSLLAFLMAVLIIRL